MIGKTISHYKILEKLGGGGMGVVYKAEDTKLKRIVALKFLPAAFSYNEEAKERFIHEAQAASALQDKNICTIHEIDETEDGQLYICMDCYEGETLKEKIEEGSLTIDAAIDITIQIAEGLSRAHEVKITHRDIKPANIFITNRNEVKILDFGLAKVAGQTQLTQLGSTVGTIAYMSPEQTRGGVVDLRTDIWSLGVLFYQMVTGELPFKGEYDQAIIYSILNDTPELISSSQLNLPPEVVQILMKAMDKEVEKRYQHIDEMLHDLRALKGIQDGQSIFTISFRKFIIKKLSSFSFKSSYIIAILSSIILLIFLYYFLREEKAIVSIDVPSIAVLYLDNLGKEDDEFLSYGLTEDVIIDLSKAGLVRVPPMKDILKYKESKLSLSQIADSLRVQFILTGSFRRDSSKFRLATQLFEPNSGVTHWSERWEEPFEKITAVKTNVIIDVVNILGLSPNPKAIKEIGRKPTLNAGAYEFYLKGKYYYRQRKSTADIEIAIGFLKKAIELDSDFVLSMVQLGEIYREKAEYNGAIEIYEKALVIADKNEILTAKASILNGIAGTNWRLGNMEKALEYILKALEVFETVGDYANEAMVLSNIGILYYTFGNYDKTMEFWKRALEIDKKLGDKYGQGIRLSNISTVYIENGEFDKALEYLTSSVSLYTELGDQQGLALAYDNIAKTYLSKNDYLQASEYFQKAIEIFELIEMKVDLITALSHLAFCKAELGNTQEALTAIKKTEDKSRFVENDAIPPIVYWNNYKTYSKIDQTVKADSSINHAYNHLMKMANKIESIEQRQKFLDEVSENKNIITAWEKKGQ